MSANPWVHSVETDKKAIDDSDVGDVGERVSTPAPPPALLGPQPSVQPPRDADRFDRWTLSDSEAGTVGVWWVGAHGGAGESTLEQLLEGSRAAGHAWPISPPHAAPARVLLVARTNAHGLRAAQLAAIEWASGQVPIQLEGLVLIADAPGRLPRPLKDFAQLVSGGVPVTWRLPWMEAWLTGEPVSAASAPKEITRFLDGLRDLSRLTQTTPTHPT